MNMTDSSIITVSNGVTLGATEVRERVTKLLSIIPKRVERRAVDLETQQFYGLRLISPEGNRFSLSIQGSGTHYCSPRRNLANLAEYTDVEVGILPDARNRTDLLRFGTTYDWDTEARRAVKEGERTSYGSPKTGWLMPQDVGFTRVEERAYEDVLPFIAVSDLVADLADFFLRGGTIDGSHEDTQEWLDKLEVL